MTAEEKQCQNCKQNFQIEPEDFEFYKKINVPPPTWCPECRRIRRLTFRNERSLYKSTCALCKKDIISMFTADSGYAVACLDCWWGDSWSPMDYGKDYDFSKSFFLQWQELMKKVPHQPLFQRNAENSPYANSVGESKNVYLSYSVVISEDVYYSKAIDSSRYIFDCLHATNSEQCYDCVFSYHNYNCVSCSFCEGCLDSYFLYDCDNCQNCVLSTNLRKRQYVIRNVQYTKEDYFNELKKLELNTVRGYENAQQEFLVKAEEEALHKYANTINAENSTGDNIANTKNVREGFDLYDSENSKYSLRGFRSNDCMDADYTYDCELVYEHINGGRKLYQSKFNIYSLADLNYVEYTDTCGSSSNLFGCCGLRNKQYCILNKQYSKEEYEELLVRIKKHMMEMPFLGKNDRKYYYGDFFPIEISPYAYNETLAEEHFPTTKEQALVHGYSWRYEGIRRYNITVKSEDFPSNELKDSILQETIGCAHEGKCEDQCTTAFKIIESELQFYRKMNLPLPTLCPNCRHYKRLKQRNPLKLWKRKCMCDYNIYKNSVKHGHHFEGGCPNEFETSYSPNRKEIVYCKECYQAEVV